MNGTSWLRTRARRGCRCRRPRNGRSPDRRSRHSGRGIRRPADRTASSRPHRRRHVHRLARDEDVELVGIEDQFAGPRRRVERLPEIEHVMRGALVDIDDAVWCLPRKPTSRSASPVRSMESAMPPPEIFGFSEATSVSVSWSACSSTAAARHCRCGSGSATAASRCAPRPGRCAG